MKFKPSCKLAFSQARAALVYLTAWVVCCACAYAQATPPGSALSQAGYRSYSGDVNGDGIQDVLLKAAPKVVMIPLDDDLFVPIPVPPTSPTFVLLSNSDGTYSLNASPGASIINSTVWQADSHDLAFGDVLGNGAGAMVLRARTAGGPSFLVARSTTTGALQLTQRFTAGDLGIDVSAAGTTVELSDTNSDGRADMIVKIDGLIAEVFLADASGMFHKGADEATIQKNTEATIRAVWGDFGAALNVADTSKALQYVSTASAQYYSSVLFGLGSDISGLTAYWSGIELVQLGMDYATFAIVETYDAQRTMHILGFVLEGRRWVLEDF